MNKVENFIINFNSSSYNREQIGNDKSTIVKIYDYLIRLNISSLDSEIIINNLAYLPKSFINLPLLLELLTKSLGFLEDYDLETIIDITIKIHDLYFKNSNKIPLDEYLHDKVENRIRRIFLNSNNKYILEQFKDDASLTYIAELKFASAMTLSQKEYQEFNNYIDNYKNYQETYSPLLMLESYFKVRNYLKGEIKLFWDILFGNEYLAALNKNGISTNQIYDGNVYKKSETLNHNQIEQLDLFTYKEMKQDYHTKEINTFQICTIYNSGKYPNFESEKDFIIYYRNLADRKHDLELPKLKSNIPNNYLYNIDKIKN